MSRVYIARKQIRAFLIAFIMLVIATCAAARVYAEPAQFGTLDSNYLGKVVIISTNDVHGQLDRYQYVAGLRDELKKRNAEVFIVDSGDFLQGSSSVSWDKGMSAARMMKAVGYNCIALGNHEFDYGYERLREVYRETQLFDMLTTNVWTDTGADLFAISSIRYSSDEAIKIGFIGITTPFTTTSTSPSHVAGLVFLNNDTTPSLLEYTTATIAKLRKNGADIVIGLTHLGVDPSSAPYRSTDFLKGLSDYTHGDENMMPDLLLDGHSHTVMTAGSGGEPIMSTGTKLENVGITVIDKETKKIEDRFLYKVNDVRDEGWSNKEVEQLWLEIKEQRDAKYSEEIGRSEVELNGAQSKEDSVPDFPNGNRDGETNLGDFVADAFRYVAVTEREKGRVYDVDDDHIVVFENGGGLRTSIHAGTIQLKDLFETVSFQNMICGVYVKGSDLLEVLEASTQSMPAPSGDFPQVSGIDYSIDLGRKYAPAAEKYPGTLVYGPSEIRRVKINSINGKPFKKDDTYLVFMTDFNADGGGASYRFSQSDKKFETGILDMDALATYITEKLGGVISEDYAQPQGRIHVKDDLTITAKNATVKYCGKTPKIPSSSIIGNSGPVKFRYYSDAAGINEIKAPVNTGKYFYKAYIPEDDKYYAAESNVAAMTIIRGTAKIKAIKPAKKKIRKGRTFKLKVKKTKGSGKVTYKKVKGTKLIKVTRGGKVKVSKRCRKGKTYTIKVRATAKKNKNYNSAKRAQKVKIVIK